MPYRSKSQARAFHAKLRRHEISPKVVQEFDAATSGHFSELPEHVAKPAKKPVRRRRG